MNKRLISFVLALIMVLTMVPMTAMAASVDKFVDVTKDKWHYTFVDFVTEKGYFNGTSATTFSPDVTMTRAMFVTVLANMEKATVDNSKAAFTDVPAGMWYTGASKWAVDNKIVSGYTDGTFKPEAKITREEMCVIMDNYVKYYSEKNNVEHEKKGSTAAFPDAAQVSSWAKASVETCRAYGLVDGFEDGSFRPKNESTRAQVAAVIYKLAWLVKEEEFTGGSRPSTGTTNIYGPYKLAALAELNVTVNADFSRNPSGAVEYDMDDTVYEVLVRFTNENKSVYTTAYNQAINAAKNRGFLKADGTVKYIGIPVDMNASAAAITEDVVADVKDDVKTALASVVSGSAVDSVITDLLEGNELNPATPEQATEQYKVVAALSNKLETTSVGAILDQPEYSSYKQMIDSMNIDLDNTINAYKEQLADIKQMLINKGASTVMLLAASPAQEDIFYMKSNANKLQTYVIVDPLEVLDKQYDLRQAHVTARATGAAVDAYLDTLDPARLVNGRIVKSADDYFALVVEQQTKLYELSKVWVPTDFYGTPADKDVTIENMVEAMLNRAGSASTQVSAAQIANTKAILKAMYGESAVGTGNGLDMTMEKFIETVLPGDRVVDLTKTPNQNDAAVGTTTFVIPTFGMGDVPAGNSYANLKNVLDAIKSVYPNAEISGTVNVDWHQAP